MITWLVRFWKRHPSAWVAFVLWFLCTLLILGRNTSVSKNLSSLVNTTTSIVIYPFQIIPYTINLRNENNQLRVDLMRTKSQLTWLSDLSEQISHIQSFFQMDSALHNQLIPATVIGRYFKIGNRRIVINKGVSDGINPPMPVVTPKGVVGRVLYSNLFTSEVQLLGDPDLGIAVRNLRSRVEGILKSTKSGNLFIDGVPLTADVKNEDLWVTAGVGKIFPKGIPVAIQLSLPAPSSHFLILPVKPITTTRSLEYVFVIKDAKQYKYGDGDE